MKEKNTNIKKKFNKSPKKRLTPEEEDLREWKEWADRWIKELKEEDERNGINGNPHG